MLQKVNPLYPKQQDPIGAIALAYIPHPGDVIQIGSDVLQVLGRITQVEPGAPEKAQSLLNSDRESLQMSITILVTDQRNAKAGPTIAKV